MNGSNAIYTVSTICLPSGRMQMLVEEIDVLSLATQRLEEFKAKFDDNTPLCPFDENRIALFIKAEQDSRHRIIGLCKTMKTDGALEHCADLLRAQGL